MIMGRSVKMSKSQTRKYLINQIAPSKKVYDEKLGYINVLDYSAISKLPKSELDRRIQQKAKEMGIRFDTFM